MVVSSSTNGGGHAPSTSHSLRMRGLPYQADEKDVAAFFEGFNLVKTVVVRKNGKPTGEGYVYFGSEQEASAALARKNRESMGNRYIELFVDNKSGLSSAAGGGRVIGNGSAVGGQAGPGAGAGNGNALGAGSGGGGWNGDHGANSVGGGGHLAHSLSHSSGSSSISAASSHSPLHSGMTYAQASRLQVQMVQEQQHFAGSQGGAYPYGVGMGGGNGGHGGHMNGNGGNVSETGSGSNSLSSTPPGSVSSLSMMRERPNMGGAVATAGSGAAPGGGGVGAANPRPVVVRVRGLPFSAQDREVRGFFEGQAVREIVFTLTPNGRPTGEAFIEFMGSVTLQSVLSFQKQMLGKRYIEIFKATKQELVDAARGLPGYHAKFQAQGFQPAQGSQQGQYALTTGPNSQHQGAYTGMGMGAGKLKHVNNITGKTRMLSSAPKGTVLKLRGLPYTTEEKDIRSFFSDYGVLGVVLMTRPEREGRLGTCNGVAYVQFSSSQEAEGARQSKHKEMMGNRYIECMTHIPKGAPIPGAGGLVGQGEEGVPQEKAMMGPGGTDPMIGGSQAYSHHPHLHQQQQMTMPLQTSGTENVDYMLPNDFFRNIKSAMPQYYASGQADQVSQNRGSSQVWPSSGAGVVKDQGQGAGFAQDQGQGVPMVDQGHNMPTLQQQLEKMGLSEKGESLFSQSASLFGQAMQQQHQGGVPAYAPMGSAPVPPGYGPTDPWGSVPSKARGAASHGAGADQHLSSSPEDAIGGNGGGAGGANGGNGNANGNGPAVGFSGWNSGGLGQNQQEQAGFGSSFLDSRYKHLW